MRVSAEIFECHNADLYVPLGCDSSWSFAESRGQERLLFVQNNASRKTSDLYMVGLSGTSNIRVLIK